MKLKKYTYLSYILMLLLFISIMLVGCSKEPKELSQPQAAAQTNEVSYLNPDNGEILLVNDTGDTLELRATTLTEDVEPFLFTTINKSDLNIVSQGFTYTTKINNIGYEIVYNSDRDFYRITDFTVNRNTAKYIGPNYTEEPISQYASYTESKSNTKTYTGDNGTLTMEDRYTSEGYYDYTLVVMPNGLTFNFELMCEGCWATEDGNVTMNLNNTELTVSAQDSDDLEDCLGQYFED